LIYTLISAGWLAAFWKQTKLHSGRPCGRLALNNFFTISEHLGLIPWKADIIL
jgi:hypothetical protein